MSITQIPSLYNQSFQSDEEFTANFVARRQLLDTLSRRLKANGTENDGLHQLLIGTRGMGKTSLLRRLAIEINHNSELSTYFIPLVFREEQYNVLQLRDFWQNCGEALAEWADVHGHNELATRLDEALCSEAWNDDEGAAECFLNEMNALGKRAVLMVDNLDLILDALKENEHWTLRGSLQLRGGPIIIGASTHTLRQTADRNAAFYEFFQPSYLEPLDLPETERCMRTLAKRRDDLGKKVVSILNSDPARLKVLHRLSGGNPRVLALTYRFLETTDAKDAMGDLERLLDEVTPYYKARIEEYQTSLQRATIDAIALHWDPVTTGQLAEITGVPNTTLSSQLHRLRKDGLIETVETSGSYSGYQITERFLNIWYLMRHGTRRNKQRMRWLVAFLSSFYSRKDLAALELEAKANGSADQWTKDYADAFAQAQQHATPTTNKDFTPLMKSSLVIGKTDSDSISLLKEGEAMLVKGFRSHENDDLVEAIATYDALIKRFIDSSELALVEIVAYAMFNKAIALGQTGDAAAEVSAYDALITRFADSSEPALLEHVVKAMLNKGTTLGQHGDLVAAIATFDALITRFACSDELAILKHVANAMFNKAIAFDQSGDTTAELATYDALITSFADSAEFEVLENIANAMANKVASLGQLGDLTGAIATCDALITRFANSSELSLLKHVASAMFNKGIAFGQSGNRTSELDTYEALITRFADSSELAVLQHVASAIVNKGTILGQLGDATAAIATFDALITRFSGRSELILKEQVASAMFNKAIALNQNGDSAAEINAYDELITYFSESTEIELQEAVANAMVNKGSTLGQHGDTAAAIATFDTLISRFADHSKLIIMEHVASAMFNKAIALNRSGDPAAEINAYDALITRFVDGSELAVLEHVANAMVNKGIALEKRGDTTAAIATCDALISRFIDCGELALLAPVANAMFNKAVALDQVGDLQAEIITYEALITRFIDSSELTLLEPVANAMVNKGITLVQLGDSEAAITTFDSLITRFIDTSELALLQHVANAIFNKAIVLGQSGDTQAEISTYDTLITRFYDNSSSELLEWVAKATFRKAITLGHSGNIAEEITVYEKSLSVLERVDTESAKQLKTIVAIRLGNKLLDNGIDNARSESLFLQAIQHDALFAYANLFWLYITSARTDEAKQALSKIEKLPPQGMMLINSALAFEADNFGEATFHLEKALSETLTVENFDFTDDLERLLRLAIAKGFGEKLIAWFDKTRFSERYAPVHAAFLAAVRGERKLLDINPEVRHAAREIYSRLVRSKHQD